MAESKHTPGEWLQVRGRSRYSDNAPVEIRKATATGWSWGVATEAEQREMTAAHDLLKALRALVAVHRALDTTGVLPADKAIAYGRAEAAITKAIGGA